ncbi:MAG TPA: N-acetyltransferase [Nocardioidaceae bacterium]|nr:N-acetyltransferase [Nocardioidaceae bacterium]
MTTIGSQSPPGPPPGAAALPDGWSTDLPGEADVPGLTELLRRHEERARGWASASAEQVRAQLSGPGAAPREHLVVRDPHGAVRGWASAHDRAAGRLVLDLTVDRRLDEAAADSAAATLLGWGDAAAARVGAARGLPSQQVDAGAFADDDRQHRWLERAGFTQVRTWWQMTRPVTPDEADLDPATRRSVRIRRVRRQGTGLPDEEDLRTVHDVLEAAFADHFNSHEETFDEFVSRLREDPGHRWDHWWIAELVEDGVPTPAGTLVGSVIDGTAGQPDGSYVEYLGVLGSARGRGVAKSLLRTVIADAAASGRDRVGLEVDADSPTGADGLYLSMGWATSYVTESWHKDVPVPASTEEGP